MSDNISKANRAPRCVHLFASGLRCTQPARRERNFCRFHDPILKRNRHMEVPFIEDAPSLQAAVAEVVNALVSGKLDKDTANVAFQGIRMAAANLKDFQKEMYTLFDASQSDDR